MANTPNYGLPYPTDYQEPADSPNALGGLATTTDTQMRALEDRVVGWVAANYSPNGHTHPNAAQLLPSTGWALADGQMAVHSWDVGSLAAGEEKQVPIAFTPGTYFVCSVQHSSTYIHAVVQDLGNGTGYIKARNSTTATPHTNVKVHVLTVNPPGA